MTYFCLQSSQSTFYASHNIAPDTKFGTSPCCWNPQRGLLFELSEEDSLLAEVLQIVTSSWFLPVKYCFFGICPSLVLFGLCHISALAIWSHTGMLFLEKTWIMWLEDLLARGYCFIMAITISLRPQTGFPSFCYHNTLWLWFFSLGLCNCWFFFIFFFIKENLFSICRELHQFKQLSENCTIYPQY